MLEQHEGKDELLRPQTEDSHLSIERFQSGGSDSVQCEKPQMMTYQDNRERLEEI